MGVGSQRHASAAWSLEKCHSIPSAEVGVGFQAGLKGIEKKISFAAKEIRNLNFSTEGVRNVCLFLVIWLFYALLRLVAKLHYFSTFFIYTVYYLLSNNIS